MVDVVLDRLEKAYSKRRSVITDLTLTIDVGELVALTGPPASGKTTALRMVAGLERITAGELRFAGRRVNETPTAERKVAVVAQPDLLSPRTTVATHVGAGLVGSGLSKPEARQLVEASAELVGLGTQLDARLGQLSPVQRYRVALAAALVQRPSLLVLDEPLEGFEARARAGLRAELVRLQQRLSLTTLYATRNSCDALAIADRVVVLREGTAVQVGSPRALYEDPDNLFVAAYMGSPPMNLVEATVHASGTAMSIVIGQHELALDRELVAERPALRNYLHDRVAVGVRAEHLHEGKESSRWPADRRLSAEVLLVEGVGPECFVHLAVDAPWVPVEGVQQVDDLSGPVFGLGPGRQPFVAHFHGTRLRPGDVADVEVDTSRLHFFDLSSGQAIRA